MLLQAETGSSKTLAFLLPTIQRLAEAPDVGAILVVSPTRELVLQLASEARARACVCFAVLVLVLRSSLCHALAFLTLSRSLPTTSVPFRACERDVTF